MNCREFESVSRDLARNQGISEDVCQKALAHVESCTRCRERWDEERTLSARLHLLAASMERERAPVELETILISTYRQRISSDRPSLSIPSQTFSPWLWRTGRSLLEVAAHLVQITQNDHFPITSWQGQHSQPHRFNGLASCQPCQVGNREGGSVNNNCSETAQSRITAATSIRLLPVLQSHGEKGRQYTGSLFLTECYDFHERTSN